MPEKQNKGGRPSTYDPAICDLAERVVGETGATNGKLAKVLGVATSTIGEWMVRHTQFADAIKRGRDKFDSEHVERSLLQRALGYEYDEITVEEIMLTQGKGDAKVSLPSTKVRTTKKMLAPDVAAICFWLCNRHPDRWQNIQKQIHEGRVDHKHDHSLVLDLTKLGREKLEQLKEISEASGGVIEMNGKKLELVAGRKAS